MKTTIIIKAAVLAVASFMTANAFADDQWNVTAGYVNTSNTATSSVGGISVVTHNYGFYAGVGSETAVKSINNFYIDAAILGTYLGDKDGSAREDIFMLNFPIRAKYKGYVNDNLGLFAYAGPLASIGLYGRDADGSQSIALYGNDGLLNRFDIKIGLGAGIELSHKLTFRFGYDYGIFNASKISGVNMHIHWCYFGVAVNI